MYTLFKTIIIEDLTLKESCVVSSIYHLNKAKKRVIVSLLCSSLKISQRSMSDILKNLIKKQYITVNIFHDNKLGVNIRYYYASKKTYAIYGDYKLEKAKKEHKQRTAEEIAEREKKAADFRKTAYEALLKIGVIKK